MSDAKIKHAGDEFDAANLRNAREFLRTPEGRSPLELDWARRVIRRLWPPMNRERGALIELNLAGKISSAQSKRLAELQDYADWYLGQVAPRPDPYAALAEISDRAAALAQKVKARLEVLERLGKK